MPPLPPFATPLLQYGYATNGFLTLLYTPCMTCSGLNVIHNSLARDTMHNYRQLHVNLQHKRCTLANKRSYLSTALYCTQNREVGWFRTSIKYDETEVTLPDTEYTVNSKTTTVASTKT